MLLSRGADIDGRMGASPPSTDPLRMNPLVGALKNGHVDITKTLLQHGARVYGQSATELAVEYGQREILQFLIDSCDHIPFHLLINALSQRPIVDEVLSLLCSKLIVPDAQTSSHDFEWLLRQLIQSGELYYAKLLMEKGSHMAPLPCEPKDYRSEEPPEQEHPQLARTMIARGWVSPNHTVQYVKRSVEEESYRPEKRPRLE